MWAQPIRLDPKWNNGDYYGKAPPIEGLKAALKWVSLQANSWEWARTTFGTAPAEAGRDPASALANKFKIEGFLDQAATARGFGRRPITSFIFARRTNSRPSIRQTSKRLHLYFMRQTISYFTNRSSARPCRKSQERVDQPKAPR